MKQFAKIILKILGWRAEGSLPDDVTKCVAIMAPHTSMWDFFYGFMGYMALGYHSKYLIKKEMFFFPLGFILKALGGIPVDRSNAASIVLSVSDQFKKHKKMILTITPEGTRKYTSKWKKGFYLIAAKSNVPICCVFVDYKRKLGGTGPCLIVSGDYEKDLSIIEDFFSTIGAKYPEKTNLKLK